MKNSKLFLSLGAGLLLVVSALGYTQAEDQPLPDNTGSTETQKSADSLEPEVTIIDGPKGKVEEYRSNGRLYMIKVYPSKGKPYYLVDADGDGMLETRRTELSPNLLIPSWVLFSW